MSTETCILTLTGHTGVVYCLIQLRNGDLVSGSCDDTIKIWNIETRACIQTLAGHTDSVYDLLELKNGNIVSGRGWDTCEVFNELRSDSRCRRLSGFARGACRASLKNHVCRGE